MTDKEDFEVISIYTRKQAIEDGVLADVTEWAKEVGFKIPVALTEALWNLIEYIPEGSGQDIRGRAHDVLFMASLAARKGANTGNQTVPFEVIVSKPGKAKYKAKLLINIGPGDVGEPVITIGFPEDF